MLKPLIPERLYEKNDTTVKNLRSSTLHNYMTLVITAPYVKILAIYFRKFIYEHPVHLPSASIALGSK